LISLIFLKLRTEQLGMEYGPITALDLHTNLERLVCGHQYG